MILSSRKNNEYRFLVARMEQSRIRDLSLIVDCSTRLATFLDFAPLYSGYSAYTRHAGGRRHPGSLHKVSRPGFRHAPE